MLKRLDWKLTNQTQQEDSSESEEDVPTFYEQAIAELEAEIESSDQEDGDEVSDGTENRGDGEGESGSNDRERTGKGRANADGREESNSESRGEQDQPKDVDRKRRKRKRGGKKVRMTERKRQMKDSQANETESGHVGDDNRPKDSAAEEIVSESPPNPNDIKTLNENKAKNKKSVGGRQRQALRKKKRKANELRKLAKSALS